MKLKKVVGILFVLLALILTYGLTNSYAANSKYILGITNVREPANGKLGGAYKFAVNTGSSTSKKIWKIVSYDTKESTVINYDNAFYCLKAEHGFAVNSSQDVSTVRREYDTSFNMKTQKTEVMNRLNDINVFKTDTSAYNKVMWILDNMYLPKQQTTSQRDALLTAAEIIGPNGYEDGLLLTDDDIEVVQQMAIWYFTNSSDSNYHRTTLPTLLFNNWSGQDANYLSFEDLYNDPIADTDLGLKRQYQAEDLYSYLITNAEQNANYISKDAVSPLELDKSRVVIVEEGSNYKVGPYKINKKSDLPFTVNELKFKDENGNDVTVNLKDASGNAISAIVLDNDFYVTLPNTTSIQALTFVMSITYSTTEATYYTTSVSTYKDEQPVVLVEKTTPEYRDSVTVKIPTLKEFDLALRKSITKLNKDVPTVNRLPQVDVRNLKNGTETTATYNHPKDALVVNTDEEIEYTFTIFNEGDKDGYAAEIKDYLPAGIEFVELVSDKTKYTAQAIKNSDGTTIVTITNIGKNILGKYNNGDSLNSEQVTIKCKITKTSQTDNVRLVNVAEITKYFDSELNKLVSEDRDSQIENFPQGLFNNQYEGKEKQGSYVKGQQDDDDFEAVVLLGKEFDLALRKSITKLNKAVPTVNRLPQVDVRNLKNGTETTATYNHPKDALLVNTDEEIEYTFTIFNEGDKDGYAAEIKDYLPAGIEFVELVSDKTKYTAQAIKNSDGTTTVTISNIGKNILGKYNNGDSLNSEQVTIKCKITKTPQTENVRLVNVAEITKYFDSELNKLVSEDKDSQIENFPQGSFNNEYEGKEKQGNYVKGQQDDDDFEAVVLLGKEFDLALRKFVTQINGRDTKMDREPVVNITKLANGTETTAIYNHSKVPLSVSIGDIVTYTIRIYNEGTIDGYASEITDYLPPQLEFLPDDETNIENGWTYDDNDVQLRKITTKHLSSERDEDNLIKAFDGKKLDYKDIIVKCKVKSNVESNEKITNIAEITEFRDSKNSIIVDRDSEKRNVILPSDEELPNYKDDKIASGDTYIPGQQDDDDFEKLKVQIFDLALRKFITKIDDTAVTNRIPQLSMGEDKKIKYTHTKEPVEVRTNNVVTYTLRIFNEGDIAGYASEITDNLPEGLEFLPDNATNKQYRWIMIDEDGNQTTDVSKAVKVTTDYLSKDQEKIKGLNLLKPFDKEQGITVNNPDYRDIKIAFKVIEPNTSSRILINTAEISNDTDKDGNPINDIDSTPGNNQEGEDDIDIEKVKLVYFDLALRKFITKVNDEEITNRIPQLSMSEEGNIKYTHTKEPLVVQNKDIVTYTLRVFNEGKISGYATEVTDDLPEGLEFVPGNEINKQYRWVMIDTDGNKTSDITKAVKITTDYLSKEQEKNNGDNLIKAFNKELGITDNNPDYKDLKIVFKVTEPNTSDRILINTAEISEDSDENGKPVDDIDSTPDNNKEGEDDIDIEKVKVKYFDLSLKKWVTQAIVIEDGKQSITETGHTGNENPEPIVKVDLKSKKINSVIVKFRYKIKVTNEGEIEGYVKEIKDYIPEGLKFDQADNPLWEELGENVVKTKQLENTLLKPGESATVEILLTWINAQDNMGLKVNVAEISKDYNESETPDIDSTPDNQKPGEDDIDDAPVILSVKTGEIPIYIGLTTIVLITLAGGIFLIKRFVL